MEILITEKMSKSFGGVQALKEVDIKIEQGTVHGLIGPNGSGKTTFFNVISGVFAPTSGKVIFDNKETTGLMPYEISKLGMSRTFQIPKVMPKMTVLENAMSGLYGKTGADICRKKCGRVGQTARTDRCACAGGKLKGWSRKWLNWPQHCQAPAT